MQVRMWVCVCIYLCMNRADKQDKCAVCEIYKAVCLITTCTCHETYAKMRNVAKSAAQHAWPDNPVPVPIPSFCMPSRYTATAYSYRLPVAALVYSIYVITFSNAFFALVPEIFLAKDVDISLV